MSIPDFVRDNFRTLLRAAGEGNLALMECLDAETAQPRYVICAVGRDGADTRSHPSGIWPRAIPSTPTDRPIRPTRTASCPQPARPNRK